ncbi:hypothetical protein ABT009_30415 [Streptomyces sp. NPDC002896]|uniref:hypothetical protein n=1 Tax=Streptomyces sp. NPDC002896 TaxID=3154438 RepID=UPI00332CE05D
MQAWQLAVSVGAGALAALSGVLIPSLAGGGLAKASEAAGSVQRGLRQSFEAIGHVSYEGDAAPQP